MGKRQREADEACPICLHYHDYEGGEKCADCGHQKTSVPAVCKAGESIPHVILEKFLYMGNYHNASAKDCLSFVGITHLLSAGPQQDALYPNSFQYHICKSKPPDLEECFQYLDTVKAKSGRVLVYDMTGRVGAPYVIVGYLVFKGADLLTSLQHVKRMTDVRLTEETFSHLARLESAVIGRSTVTWADAAGHFS